MSRWPPTGSSKSAAHSCRPGGTGKVLRATAKRTADRDRQLQVPRLARDGDEALGDRIDELAAREVHDLEVVNPAERELPSLGVLEPQREAAQPRVAGPHEPPDRIVTVHHPRMAVVLTVLGRLSHEGSGAHDDGMPRRVEGDLLGCTTAEQGAGNQDRYSHAADHRVALVGVATSLPQPRQAYVKKGILLQEQLGDG